MYRAHRGTARLVAVHALELAVDRRRVLRSLDITVDHGESGIGRASWRLEDAQVADGGGRRRQIIHLLARSLAGPAANAQRCVVQQAVPAGISGKVRRSTGFRGTGGEGCAGCSTEKRAPRNGHDATSFGA